MAETADFSRRADRLRRARQSRRLRPTRRLLWQSDKRSRQAGSDSRRAGSAAEKRVETDKTDQAPDHGDDCKNRYCQPLLANEHADQFGAELLEHHHYANST